MTDCATTQQSQTINDTLAQRLLYVFYLLVYCLIIQLYIYMCVHSVSVYIHICVGHKVEMMCNYIDHKGHIDIR